VCPRFLEGGLEGIAALGRDGLATGSRNGGRGNDTARRHGCEENGRRALRPYMGLVHSHRGNDGDAAPLLSHHQVQ
jgi:hypothetical protein